MEVSDIQEENEMTDNRQYVKVCDCGEQEISKWEYYKYKFWLWCMILNPMTYVMIGIIMLYCRIKEGDWYYWKK